MKMNKEKVDQAFVKIFLKPLFTHKDSPFQYANASSLWRFIQKTFPLAIRKAWPLSRVREFVLEHSRARQIVSHVPKRRFPRSPFLSQGLDSFWQADLVEERKLKWRLGRKKFLLTIIDVFSRQAMVGVTYNKSGASVLRTFKKLVEEQRGGITPKYLQTDEGKEFFNKDFAQYCREKNIHHYHTHSPMKAAIVERFNRTLQDGLAVLKRHEPRLSIQQAIQRVTRAYNLRPHQGLGGDLAPADIDKRNENEFAEWQDEMMWSQDAKVLSRQKPFRFRVGDYVRTTRKKGEGMAFRKAYRGNWSEQVFEIQRRWREGPRWDLNLYMLRDLTGKILKGRYYEEELQWVPFNPEERVISKKWSQNKRNRTQVVTYLDDPPKVKRTIPL